NERIKLGRHLERHGVAFGEDSVALTGERLVTGLDVVQRLFERGTLCLDRLCGGRGGGRALAGGLELAVGGLELAVGGLELAVGGLAIGDEGVAFAHDGRRARLGVVPLLFERRAVGRGRLKRRRRCRRRRGGGL